MNHRQHVSKAVKFSPSEIKKAIGEVEGFNAKVAVLITEGVGTMACAYLFAIIALVSLPANLVLAEVLPASTFPEVLVKPSTIALVAWVAQTFLQLVLLSIIMVGQAVQSRASDARAEKTFKDTEAIIEALNLETKGGLTTVLEAIEGKKTKGLK